MIKQFSDYKQFIAAVKAAGLQIRIDPPSHEGPHSDDQFEPSIVIDSEENKLGIGFTTCQETDEPDTDQLIFFGVLADTTAEYRTWQHEQRRQEQEEMNQETTSTQS